MKGFDNTLAINDIACTATGITLGGTVSGSAWRLVIEGPANRPTSVTLTPFGAPARETHVAEDMTFKPVFNYDPARGVTLHANVSLTTLPATYPGPAIFWILGQIGCHPIGTPAPAPTHDATPAPTSAPGTLPASAEPTARPANPADKVGPSGGAPN